MISRTPRFLSRVAQASASLKWYLRQHMAAMPMLMQGAELQSNQTLKSNQTHLDLEPNQARSVFHRVRESNKNSCFAVSHMLLFFLCCNFGLIEAVYAKPFFWEIWMLGTMSHGRKVDFFKSWLKEICSCMKVHWLHIFVIYILVFHSLSMQTCTLQTESRLWIFLWLKHIKMFKTPCNQII